MVENSRLGTDAVNAKASLSDIAKYAYSQRSVFGTDYALMMVMTEYVGYSFYCSYSLKKNHCWIIISLAALMAAVKELSATGSGFESHKRH